MELNKRSLKAAKEAAISVGCKAVNLYTRLSGADKTWQVLGQRIGIDIPPMFTAMPLTYGNVLLFKQFWIDGFEARLKAELGVIDKPKLAVVDDQEPTKEEAQSIKDNIDGLTKFKKHSLPEQAGCYSFGNLQLFPEQQVVFDAIWDSLFVSKKTRAAMNDGDGGSGKTYLSAAIVHRIITEHLIDPAKYPIAPIHIYTPKPVRESFARVLEEAGLGPYMGSVIFLTTYSQMTSSMGTMFIDRVTDPYDEDGKIEFRWRSFVPPFIMILDEMHNLMNRNSARTKVVRSALKLATPPYFIGLSATPFITVNDTETFAIATRQRFMGMTITEDNFNQFAGMICREPHKANIAAAKRIREIFKDYIFSFPYVKWPAKAINGVKFIDFSCERDRNLYVESFTRYVENCKKAGKEVTQNSKFREFLWLQQHNMTAEPLRVDAIVDQMVADIASHKAPVLALQTRKAVQRAVFRLIDVYKLTRDEISIIWGGKRALDTTKRMTKEEMDALIQRAASGEILDEDEMKILLETISLQTDKIMSGDEDEAAQNERLAKLVGYKLTGTQSQISRQTEIDKFQDGTAKACIFTLAAGGTGLSLDQDKDTLLQREVYMTPIYNGRLAKQAMCRCIRRKTRMNVYQWFMLLSGTTEETHVAPILDTKLKCITEVTNNRTNWVDIAAGLVDVGGNRLRSQAEREADADADASQIHDFSDGDNMDTEDEAA